MNENKTDAVYIRVYIRRTKCFGLVFVNKYKSEIYLYRTNLYRAYENMRIYPTTEMAGNVQFKFHASNVHILQVNRGTKAFLT